MARINIEDCWWTDPRRERLAALAGGMHMADAIAIRLWRAAQEFWGNGNKLMPIEVFETLEHHQSILEAKLAEARNGGIYIKGSSQYLSWVAEKRLAASAGGKKSAEKRRKKYGSAQPKHPKQSKQTRSTPEVTPKPLEPSDSGSYSDSGSKNLPSGDSVPLDPGVPAVLEGKFNPVFLWTSLYKHYFGHSPVMLKEDAGKLTNFAKGRSENKLRVLFSCYFQIPKQFYIDRGYPVGVFFSDLQSINKAAETGIDPTKPQDEDSEWRRKEREKEKQRAI